MSDDFSISVSEGGVRPKNQKQEFKCSFVWVELFKLRHLLIEKISGCRWVIKNRKPNDSKLKKTLECYETLFMKINFVMPSKDQKTIAKMLQERQDLFNRRRGYAKSSEYSSG